MKEENLKKWTAKTCAEVELWNFRQHKYFYTKLPITDSESTPRCSRFQNYQEIQLSNAST